MSSAPPIPSSSLILLREARYVLLSWHRRWNTSSAGTDSVLFSSPQAFTSVKISSLFSDGSDSLLLYDTTTSATEAIPVPLRVGDIDLDGFPDIVPIVVHKDNSRTPHVLISHPCASGTNGCSSSAGRTFNVVTKDTHALEKITDAVGVAFLDIDEDVSELFFFESSRRGRMGLVSSTM